MNLSCCCVSDKAEGELDLSAATLTEGAVGPVPLEHEPAIYAGKSGTLETFDIELDVSKMTSPPFSIDRTDPELILFTTVADDQPDENGRSLKPFDALAKVNGATPDADTLQKLRKDTTDGKKVKLSIIRPAEREVLLKKPGELGITVNHKKSSAAMWIASFKPGLATQWNDGHPDKCIALHDRIVSINGDSGSPTELIQKLKTEDTLILQLRHYGMGK